MLCLNALFKHSHDLWLTPNMQSLTTADVTFELSVDKGRSRASPGYTTHSIDMAQWPLVILDKCHPPCSQPSQPSSRQPEVWVHHEVLASLWFSSLTLKHQTPHTFAARLASHSVNTANFQFTHTQNTASSLYIHALFHVSLKIQHKVNDRHIWYLH